MTVPGRQEHIIHLVGSVPLQNAEAVFRTASELLGVHLLRLPDGETGPRADWIGWQFAVLERTPGLVPVPPVPGRYAARPHVRVAQNAGPLEIGPLGYAEAARSSYALFSRLKREGVLPQHYRFLVSLPTPLAVTTAFVERGDRAAFEPIYERRLLAELDEIVSNIPHEELALQWDMPLEMGIIEGVIPTLLEHPREAIFERISRISRHVPPGVELGFHLCYGDDGGRHFKQPADCAMMVEVANVLIERVERPINWFHMPVPRDRDDDAYFAPLRGLVVHPETELYLGLIHDSDGVEGARRRIEAARRIVQDFGIATECGMGRRPAETIPALLKLHAEIVEDERNEQ